MVLEKLNQVLIGVERLRSIRSTDQGQICSVLCQLNTTTSIMSLPLPHNTDHLITFETNVKYYQNEA